MKSKSHGGQAPARVVLATLLLFSVGTGGCGGGDNSSGTPPPTGGTGSTPPTGGNPPVGSAQTRRDGGAGDRAVQGTGATGRFCNTIILRGGMSIDFTVEIGDPAVRLTAGSRACTPADGQACAGLPTGNVPYAFSLLNPMTNQINIVESGTMVVNAGEELFMLTTLDDTNLPILIAGVLNTSVMCNALGYNDIPRLLGGPDGGAPADAAPAAQSTFAPLDELLGPTGNRILTRQRHTRDLDLSFTRQ